MTSTSSSVPSINLSSSNIDLEQVLQHLVEQGKINMNDVLEDMNQKKRNEILSQHKYNIWEAKDGYWKTNLPDSTKKEGRRKIKRKTKKELENAIVDFYQAQDAKPVTYRDMYLHWVGVQQELVVDNTIVRYHTDYKRYFEGNDFENMDICEINEEHIKMFISKTVREKKLCQKACKTLVGTMKRVFESARINRKISNNPMDLLTATIFYRYCTKSPNSNKAPTVTDEEMRLLYAQFKSDYEKKPTYIPTYAVELATLTGMRVAEISALRWDCISESYMLINKSEKYNRKTKEYTVEGTKNGEERRFPLTNEIKDLLNRVKKAELSAGYVSEWVFSNEDGRIHAPVISSCSKNKCRQIGIPDRGIHTYRKTINSKMRCSGVSRTVAASLLGHSEQVNDQYYTFDVSCFKEKQAIMSEINKNIASNF